MPPSTPIATTHAAALSRIIDNVPKGYTFYTKGMISLTKLNKLITKFHQLHIIGASPSQRHTRKKNHKANALLTLYCPSWEKEVFWLLQFTEGALDSHEKLQSVLKKPRLTWLGYELVRHSFKGKTNWTWKREAIEMSGIFGLLIEQCNRKQWHKVKNTLESAAKQPGFHGVREQTWKLYQEAIKRGYPFDLPFLYFMQKISHGEKLLIQKA